jgi:NADH dehydrogenase (ubiquinone) 1 beta subcomplex subunit 9
MSYAAAHRARVMLLYRRALKTALDWSGDRRAWYERARAVRGEFEANRVTEARDAADRLLDRGEALLKEWRHPDPLVPPYWVGGTAFSRNPPMNEAVKISLDFGREGGH